jgi:outer membrane immunogenic protein
MRQFLAAAITTLPIIAFGQIASAADMPSKAAPAYAPPPVYNWSGFYVGLNAGAAFGRAQEQTTTVFSPTGYFASTSVPAIQAAGDQTTTKTDFTGGGQIGFNWQSNHVVLGLETDFEFLGFKTSTLNGSVYPCCAPTAFTISQSAKADWLWTLRPRLGWAENNWLFYVTGGLAVTEIKGDFLFSDTFATANESASISKTRAGWALGGGVEYAWAGPWSVRVEYLHVDFGNFDNAKTTSSNLTAFTPAIAFPTNVFTHSIKFTDDIVRVGLNYRFQ